MKSRLFNHGNSPGQFPTVEDNPHIWIVAVAFMQILDIYDVMQTRLRIVKEEHQMVTEILDSLLDYGMELHIQEGLWYGCTFGINTKSKVRKFIANVLNNCRCTYLSPANRSAF